MNQKNIKKHLRKKINDWLDTITDPELLLTIKANIIVTGGSIVSLLTGEEPHDYDIYFKTKKAVKDVAEYYVREFNKRLRDIKYENKIGYRTQAFVLDGANKEDDIANHSGWDWGSSMLQVEEDRIKIIIRSDGVATEDGNVVDDDTSTVEDLVALADSTPEKALEEDEMKKDKKDQKKYRPVFLSPNAISLSDKIQLIVRFYGQADEIHENFDYLHCTSYYDFYSDELVLKAEALTSIINKELIYQGSRYPICSIIRLRKFLNRGWHINAGQILKMSFQISELNLHDPVILEEQLVGVDTMYFQVLIENIEKQIKNDKNFQVTNKYFLSVIDKVFN